MVVVVGVAAVAFTVTTVIFGAAAVVSTRASELIRTKGLVSSPWCAGMNGWAQTSAHPVFDLVAE